jgi:sialic acid synthase SpsE
MTDVTSYIDLSDIEAAIEACHSVGNHDITLLKCTSSYPAPITEQNVRSVRPGYGAAPKYLPEVIGKRVKVDLEKGSRFLVEYAE